jgi:hypothetical protein
LFIGHPTALLRPLEALSLNELGSFDLGLELRQAGAKRREFKLLKLLNE